MTLPFERTRALLYAGELLAELLDPEKTPGVPDVVHGRVRHALRHYPSRYEISVIAEQAARGGQMNPMLDAVVTRDRQ